VKVSRTTLLAVCAVVIGIYMYTAHSGFLTSKSLNVAEDYYNLLVRGFRDGHLSLKKGVPPRFAQLADPYDPVANNTPYDVHDLSYYKGKFYLYFGATPAVVLFWPYVALTGRYLSQRAGGVIFCALGFLASVGLLCALWRRYFAKASGAVVASAALALGLATFTPSLLARCDVYEVSISCGYALTMLTLAAIWKAVHEPQRRGWWLAAASLAYGLAVGARPSLLFGTVILLVPVAQTWRERRKIWAPLMAAAGPILLIGLGLMLYNQLRFDNPFEFGWRYQLGGGRQIGAQQFSPRYVWFNFRVYFLEPARWSSHFPFVHDIAVPPLPVGHGLVQHPFGVLTNIPLVWLALAVPLAWRDRPGDVRSTLCTFLAVVVVLFGIVTLTVSLFWAAIIRYEVDFLPLLVWLAVAGILSLERALAPTSESGLTDRPVRRCAVRWGWYLLLGFSVAFNLLASVERCAEAHRNLGDALFLHGQFPEALAHYEQALRLNPDYAEAHYNLGIELAQAGRNEEAIAQFEQAVRIRPDYAEAHYNLGAALGRAGRISDAIEHLQQAVRIKPNFAEAYCDLGSAFAQTGRIDDAIGKYEQALRIRPDYAAAHCDLGMALGQAGRIPEAIQHLQVALRIKPDYPQAQNALARLQARQ
jgi:Flp pilus assembly protein TadD